MLEYSWVIKVSKPSDLNTKVHSGPCTHLGDGYLCTLVDKLHHILSLSFVWSYEEALRECKDLSCILLAHEAGQMIMLSSDTVLQLVKAVAVLVVSDVL